MTVVKTCCSDVGTVVFVHKEPVGDYGRQVCLSFRAKIPNSPRTEFYAFYAHLSAVDVDVDQPVSPDTPLGRTGISGNAINMKEGEKHLHFEIRTVAQPKVGDTWPADRLDPATVFGSPPYQYAVYRRPEGLRR